MDCKIIEKCKKCKCCKNKDEGLASQISVPRPTERVIERQIVELARCCEDCGCTELKPERGEYDNAN